MAWYKVDDRLPTSRKVLRIPRERRVAAIGVWTLAGAWSAHDLTDGFIPAYMIEEWGGCETDADALVEAGLWERAEDDGDAGFQFVNWGEYQPLKADVEAAREREREKKRRQRRDPNGKFAGQSVVPKVSPGDNGGTPLGLPADDGGESAVPVPARPDPTRPDPTPTYVGVPEEWKPNKKHYDLGRKLGVFVKDEAVKFRKHAEEGNRELKNVNLAFTNWLKVAEPSNKKSAADLMWEREGPF